MTSIDRRQVLLGGLGGLGAAALRAPLGPSRAAEPLPADPGRILVLLELFGGVDGLSTVVPFRSDEYHRARPTTRLAEKKVLPIADDRGLHPALRHVHARWERGEVAIVEGCGYPEPIYSHFRSAEVWHTGRRQGRGSGDGWIGRLRRAAWPERRECELVVHVGSDMPWSLSCAEAPPLVFSSARSLVRLGDARQRRAVATASDATAVEPATRRGALLAALRRTASTSADVAARVDGAVRDYRPRVHYEDDVLSQQLRTVAALIEAGFPTRVFSLAHGNYDTHGGIQNRVYQRLHENLDGALHAFLADMEESSRGPDVALLAFSEFGRRFHENESKGTDHGAAGPMFLIGPRVRGGLHGRHPALSEVDHDDNLVYTIDFQRVYAAVLEQGFGVRAEKVLGREWEALQLLKA